MDNMPMVQPSACRMCQVKNSKLAAKDAEIARLKEQLAEARKDGDRLDWLQKQPAAIIDFDVDGFRDVWAREFGDLRTVLDAARKGAQE